MSRLVLYNAFVSTVALAEYHGTAYEVVLLLPEVAFNPPRRWRHIDLRLVHSTHLSTLRDHKGNTALQGVPLSPGHLRRANENGLIHLVLPEALVLSAGDTLRVNTVAHVARS